MDLRSIDAVNGFTATVPATADKRIAERPELYTTGGAKRGGKYGHGSKAATLTDVYAGERDPEADGGEHMKLLLDKTIDEANKRMSHTNNRLSYKVHKVTKDVMVKVIDNDTREVIREIPPEKALDAIARMWELAGIIVDEKH